MKKRPSFAEFTEQKPKRGGCGVCAAPPDVLEDIHAVIRKNPAAYTGRQVVEYLASIGITVSSAEHHLKHRHYER